MPYRLRTVDPAYTFTHTLTLDVLARILPPVTINAVLAQTQCHARRERKLSMSTVILILIAMHIWPHVAIPHVFTKLARGLRYIWPDPDYRLPSASAITYRRYQLGVKPLVALFHAVCQPLATPATPGAFLFGLRLMAIDGTVENVADTPANARAFGRPTGSRGDGAFPQLQAVYLVECGTHAIVDAGIWPSTTHERVGGRRMLRSVTSGMLVLWDRGFYSYRMLMGTLQRGAQVLCRLSNQTQPTSVAVLSDGSVLADIQPTNAEQRQGCRPIRVRLISYHLTDPALADPTEVHRLITTLLDPHWYPARALICAYHERWEIELTIAEMATQQRLVGRPLRSKKPVGVVQEMYALLIAHYAIRAIMHDAALQGQLDPDRLSFAHAVRVLQDAIPEFQMTAHGQLPQLYDRLLGDLRTQLLPRRRARSYPRVVKQKMSKFQRKRTEHQVWPQPHGPFRDAVCCIEAAPAQQHRRTASRKIVLGKGVYQWSTHTCRAPVLI